LRANPNWAEAHYNLATALGRKGDWDEAVAHFREAVRLQPKLAAAHEALGAALILLNRRDEGVQHLEKAVEILRAGSAPTPREPPDRLSPRAPSDMKSRTQ
jgi:Flp pilus assembly protein TadD